MSAMGRGSPILFGLTLLLAAALASLLLAAPYLHRPDADPTLARRTLALFAADAFVRRTAVVCIVGLALTAIIFFRPQRHPSDLPGPPVGPGA